MKYHIALLTLLALLAACSNDSSTKSTDTEAETDSAATMPDTSPIVQLESPVLDSTALDSVQITYTDGAVELTWEILAMVDFNETFNEEVQAYIPYPDFHPPVRALEGREVIVRGFVIPLEETGDETILVLSANPFSSCFFCGGAGPESVMDIKLKPDEKSKFKTDQRVAFRGKLKLNDSDLYYLNYILEDAEMVR
jgi:hypothetical protein